MAQRVGELGLWLAGAVVLSILVCVIGGHTDLACEFTGEELGQGDVLQLTCTCSKLLSEQATELHRLQSFSINWHTGLTKTNLAYMEYNYLQGIKVELQKYVHVENRTSVVKKEFNSSLDYASLQLQLNTAGTVVNPSFECVVRGFDGQDRHMVTSLEYKFSTTTSSTTTTTTTTTTPTPSSSTPETTTPKKELTAEPASPKVAKVLKEEDDGRGSSFQMVGMVIVPCVLIVIVGIAVFIIARWKKRHRYAEDPAPPTYAPPTEAWDIVRQLLNLVTSSSGNGGGHQCHVTPTCRAPPLIETTPYAVSSVLSSQSSDDTYLPSSTGSDISFVNAPHRIASPFSDEESGTEGDSVMGLGRHGSRDRRFQSQPQISASGRHGNIYTGLRPAVPTTPAPPPPDVRRVSTTRNPPHARASSLASRSLGLRCKQCIPREGTQNAATPADGATSRRIRHALAYGSRPTSQLPGLLDPNGLSDNTDYLTPTPVISASFSFSEQDNSQDQHVEIYASTDCEGPHSML